MIKFINVKFVRNVLQIVEILNYTSELIQVKNRINVKFVIKDLLLNKYYKDHEATHSDERNFKCNICPDERSFKTKHDLSGHMKFYYEPKHSCPKCGKKFFTSTTLKGHKKSC